MNLTLTSRQEFQHNAQVFLNTLWKSLYHSSIVLKDYWMWDHLCYRVDSLARYQYWSQQLTSWGEFLTESEVGGRMISTFKLSHPISFNGKTIDLIELPAPKKGGVHEEGFEHIEVVCDETFDEIKTQYPHIHFNNFEEEKKWNAELKFKLGPSSIKFHHSSLESVIRFEKCTTEFHSLQELNLLNELKSFSPLIAGTIPLGIAIESSDVDILLTASNFDDLSQLMKKNYSHFKGFKIQERIHQKEPTWICQFQFKGIAFELFAQETDSVHQKAYRHFQVEERLLKIGGKSLQQKILALKKDGYKTEPAFAKVLKLQGDPYESLLLLHAENEESLRHLIKKNLFI